MFRQQNPYDEVIEKATAETLTTENWELNLNVCDRIQREGEAGARDAVASLIKRLTHRNANVVLYALTLAEAMVKNCGTAVHRELASRTFTSTLVKVLNDKSVHESVKRRILELIQQWVLEFRHDTSLGLLEETYQQLRAQSFHFPNPQKPEKKELTDTERQREEEELELALALSLSAAEAKPVQQAPTSTSYGKPSQPPTAQIIPPPQRAQVRALYDFIASEPGELGFARGDVINVIDSSYKDWWKGESKGRTGIFPVNYVEKVLPQADAAADAGIEANIMNEARKVERLLQLLNSLDPRTDNISDDDELMQLYNSTLAIRPKLVRLIEKYNQKKEELLTLNDQFGKARTTYNAMMESSVAKYSAAGQGYYPPQQQHQAVPHHQQQQQHVQTSHGAPLATGVHAMPTPTAYYSGAGAGAPAYPEGDGGGYYHAPLTNTSSEYGQVPVGGHQVPQVAEGYYHGYQQHSSLPQQQQQQQQQQQHQQQQQPHPPHQQTTGYPVYPQGY